MQYLIVTSGFNISNLGYNFNLKLVGNQNAESQLATVNQKYEIYKEDIQARIEKQAKANDAEKESKGFLFTILNGMNGGSGSMGQRFTQAVKSEVQSRITGAVAEATGLPASLVGALVGGSSMKDAVKAYVKDETVNAISKATGIPAWMISNQMEKMNKPKEQWYQTQEFQMVTTVVAVAAAPFTGGASLAVMMAVGAGIGAATGAASGGLKGALVGAVGGAAGAAVKSFTGGAVNVGLSYSAENGFGASVGVGYGPATVSVGISERGGTSVDVGFNKAGFNAGLSYNSKTGSVSGSAGFTSQSSGTGFALSYSEGDGFGASLSKSFSNGLNGGLSWSEKGGVGGNIGYEAPGDKDKPKNSLANQMKGAGGTLSFSERDGLSAALNASGGVNAGNWSQSGGFQANSNFLADKWKADFVSGKAKEDAEAQAKQREANSHSGADVLNGAGYAGRRQDGEDGATSHAHDHDDPDSLEPAGGKPTKRTPEQMDKALGLSAGTTKNAIDDLKGSSKVLQAAKEALDPRKNVVVKSNETDVTYAGGMYQKLKDLEGKHGVTGGRLIMNNDSGSIYYRSFGEGGNSEVYTRNGQAKPGEHIKTDNIAWTGMDMHTDADQIGQADYYAKRGTELTILNSKDGKFTLEKFKSGGNVQGNMAIAHFKDAVTGEARTQTFSHMDNKMPSYVKEFLNSPSQRTLTLPTGTVFGTVGFTGNIYAGHVTSSRPLDMTAHTHMGFGGYKPTETNYNKSFPYWDYSVIDFDKWEGKR
ncbi:hypothetical protein [Leptospira weilii]|uniref:hypothetical protein n=1 Tax=Leptospira weilii TaxID=28184 RepID=UPI001EF3216D|nr:hypothetical protein [Leptospira weilii]ULH30602.1 hypothetical protein FH586_15050 [Leptospira weilii]